MDEQLYDELIIQVRAKAVQVHGILGTEKCFIRKSGMRYHIDLHAIVEGEISVKEGHRISHELKDHLVNELPNLGHVIIHIEPND